MNRIITKLVEVLDVVVPTFMAAMRTPLPPPVYGEHIEADVPVVRFIKVGQLAPDGCKRITELNFHELCYVRGALDGEKNWRNK